MDINIIEDLNKYYWNEIELKIKVPPNCSNRKTVRQKFEDFKNQISSEILDNSSNPIEENCNRNQPNIKEYRVIQKQKVLWNHLKAKIQSIS